MEFTKEFIKDIGLKKEVEMYLPTAVVGGAYLGSISNAMGVGEYSTILNHVVPAGRQLKMLFLRICSSNSNGAVFSIYQTNPTAAGQTGAVEAYPVVGSVPSGYRDYPAVMANRELVTHGRVEMPIHVLEGSVEFRLHGPLPNNGAMYSLSWWGVEINPEE